MSRGTDQSRFHVPVLLARIHRHPWTGLWQCDEFAVVETTNGREAVAILRQRSDIDLIVSDVQMPIMGGRI